jgi:hypothetical protein
MEPVGRADSRSLPSHGLQEASERRADDLGGRSALGFCAFKELVAQLGVKPDRLDARGRRA